MTIEQLQAQLKEAQEQNRLCNYAKAEEIVHEVLRWCDELQVKENPTELETLRVVGNLLIGETLWRRGQVMEAIPFAETARTCSEKLKSIEYSIQYRLLFATIYLRISEYQSSLEYIEEAENIATEHGREKDLVIVKNMKGEVYQETGPIQDAVMIFKEVIELAKFYEMNNYRATATKNLGFCSLLLGEYDEAVELYAQSIEYYKILNSIIGQATAMASIGTAYLVQGNWLLSVKWLHEALQFIQDIDNNLLKASIYTNIGSCYRGMGDFQRSLEYYFNALNMYEKSEIKGIAVNTLGNIAIVYRFLKNYDLAKFYFTKTFEMLIDRYGSTNGDFLGNYAIMLYELNEYNEAEKYLRQTVISFQESKQIIQEYQYSYYLGRIYLNNNEFDKAKEIAFRRYKVFCEHNRNDEIPGSLDLLGDLYANPGFDEYNVELAEQYYLQALDKFVENGAKHGIYHSHQHIAQFYKELGRWEEYAAHIEKSIEVYKEVQTDEVKKQADRFGWEQRIAEMEKEKEIEKIQADAETKKLEQQLVFKQREVEVMIHELVDKNNILHEIQKDVEALSKYTMKEGNNVVERLLDRIKRHSIPLDSKKELEQQWAEVHAPFMDKLKRKYPSLTATELKVCVLLKMKLTSSNICSVLFLSKRTVEFHRLNIRKKMELGKDDDLYVVLNAIAEG